MGKDLFLEISPLWNLSCEPRSLDKGELSFPNSFPIVAAVIFPAVTPTLAVGKENKNVNILLLLNP